MPRAPRSILRIRPSPMSQSKEKTPSAKAAAALNVSCAETSTEQAVDPGNVVSKRRGSAIRERERVRTQWTLIELASPLLLASGPLSLRWWPVIKKVLRNHLLRYQWATLRPSSPAITVIVMAYPATCLATRMKCLAITRSANKRKGIFAAQTSEVSWCTADG